MHNSKEKNLRFKIAFSETNIRWLLGCSPVDHSKVEHMRGEIKKAEAELQSLSK